jgi:hypothetical protein
MDWIIKYLYELRASKVKLSKDSKREHEHEHEHIGFPCVIILPLSARNAYKAVSSMVENNGQYSKSDTHYYARSLSKHVLDASGAQN